MTPSDIAWLRERLPADLLRAWAKAYRDAPKNLRFPSDPDAEFFPVDLENAATALDSLSARVKELEAEVDERDSWILAAQGQRDEAYERAAKAARQIAINAERRAANHTPQSQAEEAALNKAQGAFDAEAAIRRLASGPEGGSEGEK